MRTLHLPEVQLTENPANIMLGPLTRTAVQNKLNEVHGRTTTKVLIITASITVATLTLIVACIIGWRMYRPQKQELTTSGSEPAAPAAPPHEANEPLPPRKPDRVTGIGVMLARDQTTRKWMVTRIFPDSPAAKAGLPTGILLDAIDDVRIDKLPINDVSALLRGQAGSKVTLEICDRDRNETNRLELIREDFNNRSR